MANVNFKTLVFRFLLATFGAKPPAMHSKPSVSQCVEAGVLLLAWKRRTRNGPKLFPHVKFCARRDDKNKSG